MQPIDRNEIIMQIRERAASDAAFRSQLMSDPSAAVSALLGLPIPAGISVTIHEETPTDIHLVIPQSSALNDQDLDLVAGGLDWSNYTNPGSRCGCGA
jgi:hypothetical protein